MEIFYKIMEVNVADYSPGLDVSFIMFEARQCSRNPTVVVHNWIVLAFLDIQHFSKYSRETEKTFRRRGWSYIIIWIYYCQICNKDGFCKSEEILETTRSTTVPVFVRSFNPELLVVVGGWGGGKGGEGVNTFFDVFQRWKNLLWQPKLCCKFFLCPSRSLCLLSGFWIIHFANVFLFFEDFWIKTEINSNNIAQQDLLGI